jgi:predicted P-loop ATPase
MRVYRQCANPDIEFIDPTGNRRYWPFDIDEPIDVKRITADRDQLWAEANIMHKNGYEWWLSPAIELIAGEQQDKYTEEESWCPILTDWIDRRGGFDKFTIAEAMAGAFNYLDPKTIPKPEELRAAKALRKLGYQRHKIRLPGGKPLWRWLKVNPSKEQE